MRSSLKQLKGQRLLLSGVFISYGVIECGITALVRNVKNVATGELLTDHIWIQNAENLLSMKLRSRELIEFEATVQRYNKKHIGRIKTDFSFANATKCRRVNGSI